MQKLPWSIVKLLLRPMKKWRTSIKIGLLSEDDNICYVERLFENVNIIKKVQIIFDFCSIYPQSEFLAIQQKHIGLTVTTH